MTGMQCSSEHRTGPLFKELAILRFYKGNLERLGRVEAGGKGEE